MPKKTTILIAVLALVTIVLLFLAVTSGQNPGTGLNNLLPPQDKTVEKTATVSFAPATATLTNATVPTSVDIMVDTAGSEIAGVQVEAQYDPEALSQVILVPAADANSFFGATGAILFNDIDPVTGRISYAVAIAPGQNAKSGSGKIATLTFQKAPGATAASTTVNFLDKTLVTMLGENESVLKAATPLTITLGGSNTIQPTTSVQGANTQVQTQVIVTTAPPTQ